jgi:hypothetical protein
MNVLYGTVIDVSTLVGSGIAGQTDVSLAVLLTDSAGTPLEGFTIQYAAYHDQFGLLLEDSIIQQGQEPMTLDISLDLMGNYTILLAFPGTTHYHPSLAAEEVNILGTVEVIFDNPVVLDRSDDVTLTITLLDEQSQAISLDQVEVTIELIGSGGTIDITNRLTLTATMMEIDLEGFAIGAYTVNVLVDDSSIRIGATDSCQFAVIAETTLHLIQEDLPGILSEGHELTFVLEDSLSELLSGETVYVSIYNPEDREIYGSPLTERTALQVSSEGTEVFWRPSLVGEYVIVLAFDGTDFLNASSLEMQLLVRYLSIVDVSSAERVQFGESVPLSISLTGGITKLTGMDITVLITLDGSTQQELTVTTGSFGRVDFSVTGLFAGNHSIVVRFVGNENYAPSSKSLSVIVEPLMTYDLDPVTPLHAESECSVSLTVNVLGVYEDWSGTMVVEILSPVGTLLGSITIQLSSETTETIQFVADSAGSYYINCTVYDLPVLGQVNHMMAMDVVHPPMIMQLDAGTTPVLGGLGILLLIGAVFWRKMDSLMSSIPTDWSS